VENRWIWRALAVPGVAWLSIFFLVAMYAVLSVALGNQNTLNQPLPYWNPLDWNVGYLFDTVSNIVHNGPFLKVFLRTVAYVFVAMAFSLAIGYPVAYYAARHAGRWRGIVLLLLVLPFWINYLMRMLAWINLLSPGGWGTRFLHDFGIEALFEKLGLLSQDGGWLDGQATSVVIVSRASGSSPRSGASLRSTSVTFTPSRLSACAHSQAIGPAPPTTSEAGRSVSRSRSSLVR
jgi:spermidine/putrescine transport system permease protein